MRRSAHAPATIRARVRDAGPAEPATARALLGHSGMAERSGAGSPSTSPWRRRLRRIGVGVAVSVGVVIVLRLLLPAALSPLLAWQAGRLLGAPVEIGDVDLVLWRGRASVESFAVLPPRPPPTLISQARADALERGVPWLSLERATLEIDASALLEGRFRLHTLRLVEPRIRVLRFGDGGLNLAGLRGPPDGDVPARGVGADTGEAEAGTSGQATPEGSDAVVIDRFTVTDGAFRFRDFTVPATGPIEVQLEAVRIHRVRTTPGGADTPTTLSLRADVAGAPVAADIAIGGGGPDGHDLTIDGRLDVAALPLDHGRAYLRNAGWRGLAGTADLSLRWRSGRGIHDDATLALALHDAYAERWRTAGETGAPGDAGAPEAEKAHEARPAKPATLAVEAGRLDLNASLQAASLPRSLAREGASAAPDAASEGRSEPEDDAGLEAGGTLRARTLTLTDRTATPFVSVRLDTLAVEVDGLAWPERRLRRLALDAETADGSPVTLRAEGRVGDLEARLDAEHVALPPFNPYAQAFAGYAIVNGTSSLHADVTTSPQALHADTRLVLHDLTLETDRGGHPFADRFGLPVALSLALLRDVGGDVTLDFPIDVDRESGARVDVGTTIAGALRRALVNALASPLRILGAVVTAGGEVETFDPAPIPARPGRTDPTGAGRDRIDALARVLVERPTLAVTLTGRAGPADRAWWAENAGDGSAPTPPDPDDVRPGPDAPDREGDEADAAALAHLAQQRARATCRLLRERHGVPASRIRVVKEPAVGAGHEPGTHVGLAVASNAAADTDGAGDCEPAGAASVADHPSPPTGPAPLDRTATAARP